MIDLPEVNAMLHDIEERYSVTIEVVEARKRFRIYENGKELCEVIIDPDAIAVEPITIIKEIIEKAIIDSRR